LWVRVRSIASNGWRERELRHEGWETRETRRRNGPLVEVSDLMGEIASSTLAERPEADLGVV
jgi:hypothetical protein